MWNISVLSLIKCVSIIRTICSVFLNPLLVILFKVLSKDSVYTWHQQVSRNLAQLRSFFIRFLKRVLYPEVPIAQLSSRQTTIAVELITAL